jgi:hypothetical protein
MTSIKMVMLLMCDYDSLAAIQKSIVKPKKLSVSASLNLQRVVNRGDVSASPLSRKGLILPRNKTNVGRSNRNDRQNGSVQSKNGCDEKRSAVSPQQWEMFPRPLLNQQHLLHL